MKDKPLVSVIINNYNYGRFLREAIDSVLKQAYSNVEVIVVDDGSTDESRDIITSYQNRIIPVLKENGGQASAFNAGFLVSRGEIVCFLDSDDVWLPDKVSVVVEAAALDSEAVVICHRMQDIDIEGKLTGKSRPESLGKGNIKSKVLNSGGWWQRPPTSAMGFRRKYLEKVMPIPETSFRISADGFIGDLAPILGNVISVNEVLALYRIHGANHWTTDSAHRKIQIYETSVNEINKFLESSGVSFRLSIKHHWPCQNLKFQLGKGSNIFAHSWLALRFPGEPRFDKRLKNMVKLWLLALRIQKPERKKA